MEQWAQHQPKGVPQHVRQTFEYFIFTAAEAVASPSKDEKDEAGIAKPDGKAGTAPATAPPDQPASAGGGKGESPCV